jgi:hypothetical protein
MEKTNLNKIRLGIHTVFIIKENIPFLREWIVYHLNLSFDKIFLYDNTGSIGADGSTDSANKYSFNFDKIVTGSDSAIQEELNSILNDFKDIVVYIKWQPRNEKNQIIYAQSLAMRHYAENYKDETDYTAYIDIDEFIFSPNDINIKDYIFKLSQENVTKIILNQKKFRDRFCSKISKNVIDITSSIENVDTTGWAPKIIIKNFTTKIDNNMHIHLLETLNGETFKAPEDTLRFNHYNVNRVQIDWMKGFYGVNSDDVFEYGYDDSMKRYSAIVKEKCGSGNNFIDYDEINNIHKDLCLPYWVEEDGAL